MLMPFGKHRGKPLSEVPPDYLTWFLRQSKIEPGLRQMAEVTLMGTQAVDYLIAKEKQAQIPDTDTIKALIRTCFDEGWETSSTKAILADAMEDAGYREPSMFTDILGKLRRGEEVDRDKFEDMIIHPDLRGTEWSDVFSLIGMSRFHLAVVVKSCVITQSHHFDLRWCVGQTRKGLYHIIRGLKHLSDHEYCPNCTRSWKGQSLKGIIRGRGDEYFLRHDLLEPDAEGFFKRANSLDIRKKGDLDA